MTKYPIVIVALVLILGCEQKPEPRESRGKDLVVVDGERYTEQDLKRDIQVRYDMVKHRMGNRPIKDSSLLSVLSNSVVLGIVPEKLLNAEYKRVSLEVSDEKTAAIRQKYVKGFGEGMFAVPHLKQHLDKKIADEAKFDAYCMKYYSDDYLVPTGLVDKTYADMEQWNKDVPLTNALFWATASNIVRRVRAGEDFAALADAYSQEHTKLPGGVYGKCDEEEFREDEGLWASLGTLKKGEVLGPVTTADGIIFIFKCDREMKHDNDTGCKTIELSRIIFYPAAEHPEIDKGKIERDIAKARREDVMNQIMAKLLPSAKVSFPNGLDGFPAAAQGKLKALYLNERKEKADEKR